MSPANLSGFLKRITEMYFRGQAYEDFVKEYSGAPGFLRRAREPGVGGMLAARRPALHPRPTGVGTPRHHQGLGTLTHIPAPGYACPKH